MSFEEEQLANLIISLQQLKGVGSKTIQKILIDCEDKLTKANVYSELFLRELNISAINKGLDQLAVSWKEIQKKSANIIEQASLQSIKILHPYMEEYPKRMIMLKNFPPILYAVGDVSLLNYEKVVAIIGTRNPTEFGAKMVERLSKMLSNDGYVIVSGLAIGCDTMAHVGCLKGSAKTIAVLPTPINTAVYPKDNQALADEIVEKGGLLISEYPYGSELRGRQLVNNLVARDEWQAGLSDGVIAAETSEKGGSKHAIGHAIKAHKPLALFDYSSRISDFQVNERYSGNRKYIKNGSAFPLFTKESVEEFKQMMHKFYSQQLKHNSKSIEYNQNSFF